jgi:competence protein ComEC
MTARLMLAILLATLIGQNRTTLDIYVVDVEGGNATLFVTPAGESVLIDSGNLDGATRDAARIMEAAKDAGLTQIDHLITTHWHADHFGGLAELARQIPIREFIDHGPNVQPGAAADQFLANIYPGLTKGATHRVAKPGDRILLKGVDWQIVASAGAVPKSPLPGAGARNPECATFEPADNNAEDPMSVGSYITFGRFRTLHLGDLTRNMEFTLMCPVTLLPPVQLFLGMHHGQDSSNSPVMTHALRPVAAIMNDGTRKGGQPYTMKSIYTSPLHRQSGGQPARHGARSADGGAAAWCGRTATAGSQRQVVLDQGVGARGRRVHGDERAEWLQQELLIGSDPRDLTTGFPHP